MDQSSWFQLITDLLFCGNLGDEWGASLLQIAKISQQNGINVNQPIEVMNLKISQRNVHSNQLISVTRHPPPEIYREHKFFS